MMQRPADRDHAPATTAPGRVSRWEWLVAALGLAIVATMLAIMALEALGGGATPPDIVVRVEAPRRMTTGWLVPYEAENRGDETAAAVRLRAVAGSETAESTLDYVPGRSRRRGAFVFTSAPPDGATARVTGWAEP